jgi:cephalosporin-C deacetylase-like acetyl esterase
MNIPASRIAVILLALAFLSPAHADEVDGQQLLRKAAAEAVATIPATQPADGFTKEGMKAIFYAGPGWHGKPTRVFAWYGLPKDYQPGTKIPAMLLVHGGGGTAFAQWVKMWTDRGYAALAMDTAGQLPRGKAPYERDPQGGPMGWGGFDQVNDDVRDQWPYQAMMDVILGDSLLRSMPEVDTDRVGIVGISWGGYLTCITAALDPRFTFAISVYGCGYLGEDSAWVKNFQQIGPEKTKAWLHAFDPSEYLAEVKIPMLWVDGTNDVNYPLEILAKSYALPKGERTLVTKVGLKHSHTNAWKVQEVFAYADWKLKGGPPLPEVWETSMDNSMAFVRHDARGKPELNYTTDSGDWKIRKWQKDDGATFIEGAGREHVKLPKGTTAWFMNLTDGRGMVVSSPLMITPGM